MASYLFNKCYIRAKHLKLIVMKKITSLLLIFAAILITSCEGPMGPPGLPGQDGADIFGTIFETDGDLTPENDYRLIFEFPNDFKVYDTDIVLVYILWDIDGDTDIWRLLPQTVILKDEETGETDAIQYNFDYTYFDVQIFLDSTLPPGSLLPGEWQNQVFRIAVLPSDFLATKSADINDFNSILKSPVLKLNTIENLNFN